MTQTHGRLKSLKPNRELINTSLVIRVSNFSHSPLYSRERTLDSILDISTISVPKHKEESLGGKSWCLRDPLWLWSYLHLLELIHEHSDQRYVALFSRSMFSMVSLLFLNVCLSIAIDLESPKDSCMHPIRSRAWE